MIKNKMNIKYGDRHDKMNAKCYKPSTYARRTPSATSIDRHPSKKNVESYTQVHHLLKKNTECYQRGHHLSEVNAKCYQQRASSSTSQESSIPKHYYIEYDWALSKFDTSSANMHSNSEYDAGTEGHHQDADINLILSQPVESSPDEDVLPEVVTPSTMSRAGISSRNVRRQSWMRDSNYDVQGSSSPAGMREAQTDELRYEYRELWIILQPDWEPTLPPAMTELLPRTSSTSTTPDYIATNNLRRMQNTTERLPREWKTRSSPTAKTLMTLKPKGHRI